MASPVTWYEAKFIRKKRNSKGTGALTVDLKVVEEAHRPENHTAKSDLDQELVIRQKSGAKSTHWPW